eukprot:Selendium_serpulae@DN5932_c1_g2_i7.p2
MVVHRNTPPDACVVGAVSSKDPDAPETSLSLTDCLSLSLTDSLSLSLTDRLSRSLSSYYCEAVLARRCKVFLHAALSVADSSFMCFCLRSAATRSCQRFSTP